MMYLYLCFFFQAEDGIRDIGVTGVQTCALPISRSPLPPASQGKLRALRPGGERARHSTHPLRSMTNGQESLECPTPFGRPYWLGRNCCQPTRSPHPPPFAACTRCPTQSSSHMHFAVHCTSGQSTGLSSRYDSSNRRVR